MHSVFALEMRSGLCLVLSFEVLGFEAPEPGFGRIEVSS